MWFILHKIEPKKFKLHSAHNTEQYFLENYCSTPDSLKYCWLLRPRQINTLFPISRPTLHNACDPITCYGLNKIKSSDRPWLKRPTFISFYLKKLMPPFGFRSFNRCVTNDMISCTKRGKWLHVFWPWELVCARTFRLKKHIFLWWYAARCVPDIPSTSGPR